MLSSINGDALQQALLDLFEESFTWLREKPRGKDVDAAELARIESTLAPRLLSPGYYKLGEYLLWLEARLKAGVPIAAVAAVEADGLCAVARARNEWERGHPPCSKCGERQDTRFALMCWNCGQEFAK
jgi:NADH pyrophosphatase NudC (nudix superfamily)